MSLGEAVAAAAEALVGAPFRLHGRSPATGLDCVGVVEHALRSAGITPHAPRGYALRHTAVERLFDHAHLSQLAPVIGTTQAGDVLLVRAGPAQPHLLVATGILRFVHADAGLRQVVHQIGTPPWPLVAHWRPQTQD